MYPRNKSVRHQRVGPFSSNLFVKFGGRYCSSFLERVVADIRFVGEKYPDGLDGYEGERDPTDLDSAEKNI